MMFFLRFLTTTLFRHQIDPRVELLDVIVENQEHLLKVELYLQYNVDQSKDVLELRLEREFGDT